MKFIPSYSPLYAAGEFQRRLERLEAMLESCTICPHDCGNNRLNNELARCYSGYLPIVSSYCQHFGEEPALGGAYKSGKYFSWQLQPALCVLPEFSNQPELESGAVE